VENEKWPLGDIYYDAAGDTLDMAHAPDTTAALSTGSPWDYQTCRDANYGGNANAPQFGNIAAGHGLCFKTPDGRLALLKVDTISNSEIVLDIVVWQPMLGG
jgi:hypothetical protein